MGREGSIYDNRIVLPPGLEDKRSSFECGICLSIVTVDRKPKECSYCHNQLYCEECIAPWVRQHHCCPHCKQTGVKVIDCNFIIMRQIYMFKFRCKNYKYGCGFLGTQVETERHERNCKTDKACSLCRVPVKVEEMKDSQGWHVCGKKNWVKINSGNRHAYFYSRDRVVAPASQEYLLDLAICALCQNILRHPKTCDSCQINFCELCISNHLLTHNSCPNCSKQYPNVVPLARNAVGFMSGIQVYCKNHNLKNCGAFPYAEIQAHENFCEEVEEEKSQIEDESILLHRKSEILRVNCSTNKDYKKRNFSYGDQPDIEREEIEQINRRLAQEEHAFKIREEKNFKVDSYPDTGISAPLQPYPQAVLPNDDFDFQVYPFGLFPNLKIKVKRFYLGWVLFWMNFICFLADNAFLALNIYFFYLYFDEDIHKSSKVQARKLFFFLWSSYTVLEILIPMVFLCYSLGKDRINKKYHKALLLFSCIFQGYYLYPVWISSFKFYRGFTKDHQFMQLWLNLFKAGFFLAYGIILLIHDHIIDEVEDLAFVIAVFSCCIGGILYIWNCMCIPCASYKAERNR